MLYIECTKWRYKLGNKMSPPGDEFRRGRRAHTSLDKFAPGVYAFSQSLLASIEFSYLILTAIQSASYEPFSSSSMLA